MKFVTLLVLPISLMLGGCATGSDDSNLAWTAGYDIKRSKHPDRLSKDMSECKREARHSSGFTPGPSDEQEDSGRLTQTELNYQAAFITCMRLRGHSTFFHYTDLNQALVNTRIA